MRQTRPAPVGISNVLYSSLIALLLWQTNAIAESTDAPSIADVVATVEVALKHLDSTNLDDDWYFAMEVVEGEERSIIHSDPYRSKYEKRQLISVNGVTPDGGQLKKFHAKEVERIDDEDSDTSGYGYLVDRQSLQLVGMGDGVVQLSFVPRVKAFEDSGDKIRGTMRLNLALQQIDQIEIRNTEALTPAFSVTVDTYQLRLQFNQEQGEQLLKKLESHAVGKAGFVKSFDSEVVVTFSDFSRASADPVSQVIE